MEPITISSFAAMKGGVIHQTTGILAFSTRSMESVLKSNGALVVEYDNVTGAEIGWAWAVGRDLIDMVRATTNLSAFCCLMINREKNASGITWHDPAVMKDRQRIAFVTTGSPRAEENGLRMKPNLGSGYRVYAIKNRCYAGYGGNPGASSLPAISTSLALGNNVQSPYGAFGTSKSAPSAVLGTVRVRVPGGLSWERRAAQYMAAIKEKVPSSRQTMFNDIATKSLARMRELADLLQYDRAGSLDVLPIFVVTPSGARFVPAAGRRNVSATVTAHRMWGVTVRDAETDAYCTWQQVVNSTASSFSNAVPEPTTSITVTEAASLAKVASLQLTKSIDGVPMDGILGGLCGSRFMTPLEGGVNLVGADLWEQNRLAMSIVDGEAPVARGVDAYGAPVSDTQYVGALSVQLETFKCSASSKIRTTNWDHANGGLSELIAMAEMAMNPKVAKLYEPHQFGVRWINSQIPTGTSTLAVAEWKLTPLFTDTSGDLSDMI